MRSKRLSRLAAVLLAGALAGCGSTGNEDCEEAKAPAQTQGIGQTCMAFQYGTCPTLFTNCAQGTCTETGNGNGTQCLAPCGNGCAGSTTCKSGLCYPRAVCNPYCDGTTCCSYTPCAGDPTTCCQVAGSCHTT